jgi:hypothetical protein|tara:strand:- start:122 stop:424 length:303 start_codon:yes stop_codon:yes gene_type:complete
MVEYSIRKSIFDFQFFAKVKNEKYFFFKICIMDFIKHKYTIGISSIIIIMIVSIHGSLKPPGDQTTKSKKNKETNNQKNLSAIDKKTGLPTFLQKIIMPR